MSHDWEDGFITGWMFGGGSGGDWFRALLAAVIFLALIWVFQ